jgi:hypothetical protein
LPSFAALQRDVGTSFKHRDKIDWLRLAAKQRTVFLG